jgi:hypothetical protein
MFTHHLNSFEHVHGPFAAEIKEIADACFDGRDLTERIVEHGQRRWYVWAFCEQEFAEMRVAFYYGTEVIFERDGLPIRRCDRLRG